MKDCIFCKISRGEFPSEKIWEDKNFLAILDLYPNTEGVTLVLSKKHYDSDVFNLPPKIYNELMLASKKVVKILEKGLNVKRVAMVFEGQGVNHVHAKLYPLHKINASKFGEIPSKEYFEEYPGYLTTLIGPEKSFEELSKIASKIKKK